MPAELRLGGHFDFGGMMKRVLWVCGALALLSILAFFGSLTAVTWMQWQSRAKVDKAIADRVDPMLTKFSSAADALTITVNGNPKAATPEGKLPLRDAVLGLADKHLSRAEHTVDVAVSDANHQLSAMRSTVNGAVDKSDKQLTAMRGTVDGLGAKVDPLLASYKQLGDQATGAVADARKAVSDNSDDIAGLLESSEVAVTSVARAGDNVAQAMPKLTKDAEEFTGHVNGIAGDIHREADEITRPKHWYEKALGPVYTLGRLVGALL